MMGRRARLLWGLLRVECVVGKCRICISGYSYSVAKRSDGSQSIRIFATERYELLSLTTSSWGEVE